MHSYAMPGSGHREQQCVAACTCGAASLPIATSFVPQVLVFCTMTRLLDVLEEHLDWRGISHVRLDGATPSSLRGSLVPPCPTPSSINPKQKDPLRLTLAYRALLALGIEHHCRPTPCPDGA